MLKEASPQCALPRCIQVFDVDHLVSSFEVHNHARVLHDDFRMVERGEAVDNLRLLRLRAVSRLAWALPTDTFVTLDLPVLLTLVCRRTCSLPAR